MQQDKVYKLQQRLLQALHLANKTLDNNSKITGTNNKEEINHRSQKVSSINKDHIWYNINQSIVSESKKNNLQVFPSVDKMETRDRILEQLLYKPKDVTGGGLFLKNSCGILNPFSYMALLNS